MSYQPWLIALLALSLNSGCKSTSSATASGPIGVGSQAVKPASQNVWRRADIHNMRYVLKPYQPTKPIFKNIAGIQYCAGPCTDKKMGLSTGVVSMTAYNAEETDKSLAFGIHQGGNYAFEDSGQRDMTPIQEYDNAAYRLDFSDDSHATLTSGNMVDGKFVEGDQPWGAKGVKPTMELVEPGHWVRHTPGYADYDLYTYIDANGNETKYFNKLAIDIGTSGFKTVLIPVPTNTPFGQGGSEPTGPFRDADRKPVDSDSSMRDSKDAGSDSSGRDGSGDSGQGGATDDHKGSGKR